MTIQKTKNNNNTNQTKRLSVQITLTGLSFLIASPNGEVLFFTEKKFDTQHTPEELLFELTHILSGEEALRDEFERVTLVYTTQNYAVVPSSLFDENKASEYLKFNTKILQNDYISYDEIKNDPSVVVYVPFVNINNYIFEQFGSFQYYHAGTLLIQYVLNTEKHSQETRVYLHVLPQQFECIILSQGKLQMCNSYSYKTPEDFIYYILFCFEQLQLNPDTVETVVCGDIFPESELHDILYTYIRHISFIEHGLPNIANEPAHQHFLLKTTL